MTRQVLTSCVVSFVTGLFFIGCNSAIAETTSTGPQENRTEIIAPQTAAASNVSAQAHRVLREMGEYLATAREFTFRADITYDSVLSDGQKIPARQPRGVLR